MSHPADVAIALAVSPSVQQEVADHDRVIATAEQLRGRLAALLDQWAADLERLRLAEVADDRR